LTTTHQKTKETENLAASGQGNFYLEKTGPKAWPEIEKTWDKKPPVTRRILPIIPHAKKLGEELGGPKKKKIT